jgi:transposase
MSQPLFVRQVTRTERVELKKLRRKPPSVEVALRAQAVLLSRQHRTVQEIGDIIGRDRSTVFRWLQAFNQHGLEALWPGKSPGAPPKADAEYQAALIQSLEHNPRDLGYAFTRWTVQLLIDHLHRQTHVQVASGTLYALLKRLGYRYGHPKLDLKHRQDPQEVARAKRQKARALKKRKPAPVVVLSRMSTKPSFISIRASLAAGRNEASE